MLTSHPFTKFSRFERTIPESSTINMLDVRSEYPCQKTSHVHALECGHWIKTKEITDCQGNCAQDPVSGFNFLCLRCLIDQINAIAQFNVEQLYNDKVKWCDEHGMTAPSFTVWFLDYFLTGKNGRDTDTFFAPVLGIWTDEKCEPIEKYEVRDELALALQKMGLDSKDIAEEMNKLNLEA